MNKPIQNAPNLGLMIPTGVVLQTPEAVSAMARLWALGWGIKRIARELGCRKNTVRHYLRQGGWQPYRRPGRPNQLRGLESWLAASCQPHRGNADVVRQELQRVHGGQVSLRTVERAVRPWRQHLEAQARATVRFDTPPGRQLQVDFGTTGVRLDGEWVRVRLFVATLGYSRRNVVALFDHERQAAWLEGLEQAFQHFGGVPEEVLLDNPRALVTPHNPSTRTVVFNDRFLAFARYWDFQPRACAPYRARTKGKDENGVGYVKRNAIAGRPFSSWAALESHLRPWVRTVADVRIHGTTGERPLDRCQHVEAQALKPLVQRPPFQPIRELTRRVHADGCIDVDTNHYRVPWRLLGESVTVQVTPQQIRVWHGGQEIAPHPRCQGRRQRCLDRAHLVGLVGGPHPAEGSPPPPPPALLRPLAEDESLAGGGW